MQFTKFEAFNEKKFNVDLTFEYDMQSYKRNVGKDQGGDEIKLNLTDFGDDFIIKVSSEKLNGFCPIKISSLKDNYLHPGAGFNVFKSDEVPVGRIFIQSEFKPHKKDDEKDLLREQMQSLNSQNLDL